MNILRPNNFLQEQKEKTIAVPAMEYE